MRKLSVAGAIALAAMLTCGCGAQPGNTTVTYDAFSKTPPPLVTAAVAGEYKLYPSDGTNAIYTIYLQPGDKYGFDKDAGGKVVAIAREQQIPLTAKLATAYYWKAEKERESRGAIIARDHR